MVAEVGAVDDAAVDECGDGGSDGFMSKTCLLAQRANSKRLRRGGEELEELLFRGRRYRFRRRS